MSSPRKNSSFAGLRITSIGTLVSRVLGMIRDMATAALLGMSAGGVMDAFVVAFRIPDLFRRLFGEGALTASYLPALSRKLEHDQPSAWQLASAMFAVTAAAIGALVLFGEVICGVLWLLYGDSESMSLLVGLAAVMLPYALLICLAAYVSATLHALNHFTAPAFVTAIFNICWLAAVWFVAPVVSPERTTQAYVLAIAVLVGGVIQVAFQWPVLRHFGFRFRIAWQQSRGDVQAVVAALVPTMLGLAVTQINTLVDSLVAWTLTQTSDGPQSIAWLGGQVEYPVRQGAAAAIYYSERLYHFPLGMIGVAIATVIFPLLSRHAARGDREQLGTDLVVGMRLVFFLAIPAGVGLVIMGEPLVRLLFERGEFTTTDTLRTSRMIAYYALGVPAYCALPVVIRGYYASGNSSTPMRVGIGIVVLNFALNLILVWPLAELGLALATAVAATLQVVLLLVVLARREAVFDAKPLAATFVRSILASAVMAGATVAVLELMPDTATLTAQLLRVTAAVATSIAVYFVISPLLGGREHKLLLSSGTDEEAS